VRTINIVFKSLYACTHQCGFCHVLHIPRNVSYMPTATVKATFDQIEMQFAGQRVEMEMSGGEFTLRHDAVELIRYLRTKKIHWSALVLDTMGVPLANEELARSLGELFHKVNVSVHASDAEMHERISMSSTSFADLEAALRNLFRFFPAVFTNTSINRLNFRELRNIAAFVLRQRRYAPQTPLFCLYYLPVYREYGRAQKENHFRLQGENNAQFVPAGVDLQEVGEEFRRARELLLLHGVPAIMRDFNAPACIYHKIVGGFPENAFGLPNFMTGTLFTDYAHPIHENHLLERVYPSIDERRKQRQCADCVADAVCPGIPEQWLKRGYEAVPIDQQAYDAQFPIQLLNQTLFAIFHDTVKARDILGALEIDWAALADSLFTTLAGGAGDIRLARERIANMPPAARIEALVAHLRKAGTPSRHQPGYAELRTSTHSAEAFAMLIEREQRIPAARSNRL
jgi:sulfatase maturation enzyme AslB (radical SAM superfamily)